MINTGATNHREDIAAILAAEKLPISDLPETLENFTVVIQGSEVIGVAGLEIYGKYGLLRSVAVRPKFRGQGVANELLGRMETLAAAKRLKEIYLLTETAPEYFKRKGYRQITRAEVPAEVLQSSEFSHVCPQSAIVMKKKINKLRI
jgi:amino-acid N-acetyltransferase